MYLQRLLPLFSLCVVACGSSAGDGTATDVPLGTSRGALSTGDGNDNSQGDGVQTIFVIAMEKHNWTQPDPTSSPQQILGNVAAPYINSLVTRGNSKAAQVS